MDSKNDQNDKKYVEEAGNDRGDGLIKDVGFGELVTLDNGVPRDAAITELPAKEQSRVLRKVDLRVVPLLTFLYLIAYIDRNNSASAFSCSSLWFGCLLDHHSWKCQSRRAHYRLENGWPAV